MVNDFDYDDALTRARAGDEQALATLFTYHYRRLWRMVELRLDGRLRGRIDPADVLQEAYVDIAQRAEGYFAEEKMPFFLWLRFTTGQRLVSIHRRHLKAKKRDASREISMYQIGPPEATSMVLADCFIGNVTSASRAAMRAESKVKLESALNSIEELDREILVLRHLEEFSNREIAQYLGISEQVASTRYIRALKQLKRILIELQD